MGLVAGGYPDFRKNCAKFENNYYHSLHTSLFLLSEKIIEQSYIAQLVVCTHKVGGVWGDNSNS